MIERVDNELRRVSTALAEVSPPKPDLPLREERSRRPRSPVLVAVASFAVVLVLGLAASLVFGGEEQPRATPDGLTGPVPQDHLAAKLLAERASFEEFGSVSRPCARSEGPFLAGAPYTVCLVDDQGTMVIVPLRLAAGVEAVVRGSAFDGEITVELPAVSSEGSLPALEELVAIRHTAGSVEVELLYNGGSTGVSLSGHRLESGTEESSTGTTVSTAPDGGPVPEDHLAAELLADGASFEEFSAVSNTCSRGGSLAGPAILCLVDDQGLVVVVPLSMPARVEASIRGSAFDGETTIALPAVRSEDLLPALEDLVAIGHEDGSFEVELRYNGEPAGFDIGGEFESGTEESSTGTMSIPDGHIANEVLALEASAGEVPDLASELGFEFLCVGGGGVRSCVIWEDGVAVIIPFRTRDGTSLHVRSHSFDGWLEIPVEVGVPVGVPHETGPFSVQHLEDGEGPTISSSYFPYSSAP